MFFNILVKITENHMGRPSGGRGGDLRGEALYAHLGFENLLIVNVHVGKTRNSQLQCTRYWQL